MRLWPKGGYTIVGNGDIASVLIDRDDMIYFASGVSNSSEIRDSEYMREIKLLLDQPFDKRLVYFSSLSIFYKESRYTKHKKMVEELIKAKFPKWTIMRLGNITFGNNPHTIINHFKLQKARGEKLDIQNAYRYIIDKEEFFHWINLIPDWNCELNVTGKKMTIQQIVDEYV